MNRKRGTITSSNFIMLFMWPLFIEFIFLFYFEIFGIVSADLCVSVLCPQGTTCDTNTGICRQFRLPDNGRNMNPTGDICSNIVCPQGSSCDTNFGVCRQFRPPQTRQNLCALKNCPTGWTCDENTGICREFRFDQNRCAFVQCPSGFGCDQNTGICRQFRTVNLANGANDCGSVGCPQGTLCDTNTGICRQFRQPALRRLGTSDSCKNVECPSGYTCNPAIGICQPRVSTESVTNPTPDASRKIRLVATKWSRTNNKMCPQNSHYVQCGSRCPYTCTDLKPKCVSDEQNCIATCQCDDGYVQATTANMTCVPAKECLEISSRLCTTVNCANGMNCIDDYCIPNECPMILKSELKPGCVYDLRRDGKNCLLLKSICFN
uniref:TIL domain-containing protein n=1 Tax=Acrobeloides nanus TaxID=290746 RepID=A0A914DQU9_9BILA